MEMIYFYIAEVVLASMTIGISIFTIIGYVTKVEWMYDWNTKTAMSLPSAISLAFTSIAILLLAVEHRPANKPKP